ncbi:MAG: 16S rRNA (adenine(1518)-N(6)/adenine(1519)-N(6))-dimethyltransferase RsmA [Betaproteobacteria bacterium]|nr:16S rRNA (adenine(1518)-N(6)/adenine(1519)-N(6))-dimethyltransferase RsmA [Betaproteobacteria bacterium]
MSAHRPRKRFGQHFLHDAGVVRRIVEAIAPRPGESMVEIGPGEGVLTRPLLERGAALTVIEVDRDLAARLAADHGGAMDVRCADALAFDFDALPRGTRVVGNLPYNISTPLLFHLARWVDHLGDMHFMLQREVVERMAAAASTPAYGRLSVMLQVKYRMCKLFTVAAESFTPAPKVESAIVRITPIPSAQRSVVNERAFAQIVAQAFSARRKTLRNALKMSEAELRALGLEPKLRPENLTPDDYVRVARSMNSIL